jgi:hypothetical protein
VGGEIDLPIVLGYHRFINCNNEALNEATRKIAEELIGRHIVEGPGLGWEPKVLAIRHR